MENDFVKYLILFLVGMCGVLIGRRMAIRRALKKELNNKNEKRK